MNRSRGQRALLHVGQARICDAPLHIAHIEVKENGVQPPLMRLLYGALSRGVGDA